MQFNSFRSGGVIYRITDTELVGKNSMPKREVWLEVPTQKGMDTKTQIFKFEVLFEETSSLDFFNVGSWVDVVFTIQGRIWEPPKEPGVKKLFNSLRIIDMKVGPNPFQEGKDIKNKPEDLSNTIVSELADNVKDWANEEPKQDTLWDKTDTNADDLPF